jgi:endonuclease/exonuclease/phosphatase family metal-dependent hydrolase
MQIFTHAGFRSAVVADTPTAIDRGTFHGFNGSTTGPHIDHIFISPNVNLHSAQILRPRFDGRSPSDHDPIKIIFSI